MSYRRLSYDNEEQWLELRSKGVGGSDVAAILGLNPYMTNLELWQIKTCRKKKEHNDNAFTEYGHLVEDPVRQIFAIDYRNQIKVTHTDEVLVNDKYPFMRASLDGELEVIANEVEMTSYYKNYYDKDNVRPKPVVLKKGMKGIYEGKTTFIVNSMAKEKWNNQIPDNYYCQIIHYLAVKDDCDFVVLKGMLNWEDMNGVKTHELRDYVCLRENVLDDIEYLKKEVIYFWNEYVLKDKEPPLKLPNL